MNNTEFIYGVHDEVQRRVVVDGDGGSTSVATLIYLTNHLPRSGTGSRKAFECTSNPARSDLSVVGCHGGSVVDGVEGKDRHNTV